MLVNELKLYVSLFPTTLAWDLFAVEGTFRAGWVEYYTEQSFH